MKVKFDKFKNLVTEDTVYALFQEAVVKKIDDQDYIEVTPDFKRVHMVLKSSLSKIGTIEVNL